MDYTESQCNPAGLNHAVVLVGTELRERSLSGLLEIPGVKTGERTDISELLEEKEFVVLTLISLLLFSNKIKYITRQIQ